MVIKDTLGPAILSLVERLSSFRRLKMYGIYTFGDVGSVLCREVVPFSEGPLLEVPLYTSIVHNSYLHVYTVKSRYSKPLNYSHLSIAANNSGTQHGLIDSSFMLNQANPANPATFVGLWRGWNS